MNPQEISIPVPWGHIAGKFVNYFLKLISHKLIDNQTNYCLIIDLLCCIKIKFCL